MHLQPLLSKISFKKNVNVHGLDRVFRAEGVGHACHPPGGGLFILGHQPVGAGHPHHPPHGVVNRAGGQSHPARGHALQNVVAVRVIVKNTAPVCHYRPALHALNAQKSPTTDQILGTLPNKWYRITPLQKRIWIIGYFSHLVRQFMQIIGRHFFEFFFLNRFIIPKILTVATITMIGIYSSVWLPCAIFFK